MARVPQVSDAEREIGKKSRCCHRLRYSRQASAFNGIKNSIRTRHRASFELARQFNMVEDVDFSANFIRLGVEMADQGSVRYSLVEEAELVSYHTRTLKELGLNTCG